VFCADHLLDCAGCDSVVCWSDTVDCAADGDVFASSHLEACATCGESFCGGHRDECTICGEIRCEDHVARCAVDDEPYCERHLSSCSLCEDDDGTGAELLCPEHVVSCDVGGESLCTHHARTDPITRDVVCPEHTEPCELCRQEYVPSTIDEGRCETCRALGERTVDVPEEIADGFRSVKGAANDSYLVVYGKRLLGANQLVVLDRTTGDEVDRWKVGVLARLRGVFK
jgi:hypothetical protein